MPRVPDRGLNIKNVKDRQRQEHYTYELNYIYNKIDRNTKM